MRLGAEANAGDRPDLAAVESLGAGRASHSRPGGAYAAHSRAHAKTCVTRLPEGRSPVSGAPMSRAASCARQKSARPAAE